MKEAFKLRTMLICWLCMWLLPAAVGAQQAGDWKAAYKSIQGIGQSGQMSYTYRIYLRNAVTGQVLDSTAGKLFRSGHHYLDSNTVMINMRDADYTLQINSMDKRAFVKTIRNIEAKAGHPLQEETPSMFYLDKLKPEFVAGFNSHKTTDGNTLLSVRFRGLELHAMTALVSASNQLIRLEVSIGDGSDPQARLERVLVMDHFDTHCDASVIRTSRYLKTTPGGFSLSGKRFASYKVIKII